VLFADVVHSMDIARLVGAERLRDIMAELVKSASSVVQRYEGTVGSFTGDGVMAVFGAPTALEDHAIRACLAAMAIQEEAKRLAVDVEACDGVELRLRVGLNSGQVIAGEIASGPFGYTTIGEHVGMAQRMESVAPPGGVMLSASTARLVDGFAALGEPEVVRIKGADQPVPARRLLGVGQQDRAAKRAESNLVGRQWEMSAVQGLLDRAIDGRGAVVGVVGPAGIGKSRLARELAAMADRLGVDVFTTFCESHTSQVPFQVVARLLRAATGVERLDPAEARALIKAQAFSDADPEDVAIFEDLLGIADPDAALPQIDPDARRRRLTALVNAATVANQTPAVYVIEDAHWIDESSESMLADFLTVVPQTPLLTVITYRPEYRGALARVAAAQTLALAPLSDPETTALVAELLGPDTSVVELRQTISERAAGTPYFAEEMVRELAERSVLQGKPGAFISTAEAAEVSVPATLQATIASRIDRLDPKAKRTLSAAAVVGSRFGANLLTALDVEPIVNDLLAAQLIDQVTFTRHPEYVFHHPLIRAVAYETQLKSDRSDLHKRVATAIEQHSSGTADENAALIAGHLEAAGDLHAAFDWHMRAGAWSNNRDVAAARASWERACRVADALPDDDQDRTTMRITPRTMLCGTGWRLNARVVDTLFEELRELCTLAGDKASLAMGIAGPMTVHMQLGDMHEASRLASEQMALLDSIGDPSLTAVAGFGGIGVKAQTGDREAVRRWAQATIEWAKGDPAKGNIVVGSPLAVALVLRAMTRWSRGDSGWREDLDNAMSMAERAEALTLAVIISWGYGIGTWDGVIELDDNAVAKIERTLSVTEAAGDDYAVTMVRYVLGTALQVRSDAAARDRGLELLAGVRDMCLQQRFPSSELPVIEIYAARDRARTGDREAGIATLRTSVEDVFAQGQAVYLVAITLFLVEALLDGGNDIDIAEAERAIDRLANFPAQEPWVVRDISLLRLRALLARARGDKAGYRDQRDRYRGMANSLGFEGHIQWAEAMP
jgi:class 3 adenylate cyclase